MAWFHFVKKKNCISIHAHIYVEKVEGFAQVIDKPMPFYSERITLKLKTSETLSIKNDVTPASIS